MERLMGEIMSLARRLEQEIRGLEQGANQSRESGLVSNPLDRGLARIEDKIERIHSHTSWLVDRLPHDIAETLAELKRRTPGSAEWRGPQRSRLAAD